MAVFACLFALAPLASACQDAAKESPEPNSAANEFLRIDDGHGTVSFAYEGDPVNSSADIGLCLLTDEPAELLSLTGNNSTGGAQVTDFDVVTVSEDAYADFPRPLDSIEVWTSHDRLVDVRCDDDIRPSLAIEVTKADKVATIPSFTLAYRVGEDEFEVPVDFSVTVCTDLDACEPESGE